MRRLTLAGVLVLVTASPASAQVPYLVTSFTQWADSPVRDLGDQDTGRYNFEAGLYGAVRRAVQRWPEHYLTPNPDLWIRHEAQVAIDSALHNRPALPYAHAGDAGHPAYMPDWDGDGVFGDSGGTDPDGRGDFDADTDDVLDAAAWRIPCFDDEYRVRHQLPDGTCDVAGTGTANRLGIAFEQRIVNGRGLVLDATVWLPPDVRACPCPGLVFSTGFSSRQEHYTWFAMRMAADGFVVLTFDPAGQGGSEGHGGEVMGFTDTEPVDCTFAGACRDTQDAVRWFVGEAIPATQDTGLRLEERRDPADNASNPALGAIDPSRIALAGNSMGAVSTLAYLKDPSLPAVVAAVSMSGATDTRATVPIQFQTSDYDGSPTLVGPGVGGVNLGVAGEGIGYYPIKERYDILRTSDAHAPLSLVVLEGGVHTDHVAVPFVPRTLWANKLAGDYAQDHLDCYAKGDPDACSRAVAPREHLSKGFASEYDLSPDEPSRCITVPTEAIANQRPDDLVAALSGAPRYDCTAPS